MRHETRDISCTALIDFSGVMAADTDRVVLLLTIRPSQKTVLALVSPQLHSSVSILISIAGWRGDVSVTLGLADC